MARRPRSITQRLTDRIVGISGRRRRVAYYAIGTGLALLRPAIVRLAWLAAATAATTVVTAVLVL